MSKNILTNCSTGYHILRSNNFYEVFNDKLEKIGKFVKHSNAIMCALAFTLENRLETFEHDSEGLVVNIFQPEDSIKSIKKSIQQLGIC